VEPYEELEVKFGRWAGSSSIVACSSGTAALHLALESIGLPTHGEVILPDFTMIACARAVILAGLVPVFVDCGADLLMQANLIPEAITERTCAIMPVHIYGRVCNLAEIYETANHYGIKIVEDRAEAHGVDFGDYIPDAACWSFYRNKIVAGEEGGAIAFKNPRHASVAKSLRSLGFTTSHDFYHVPRGHNYRLANCLAQLILTSLANVDANLAKRRQLEEAYDHLCPDEWRMPRREAPWVYDLRIPDLSSVRQGSAVRALQAVGIPARHAFKPMSAQPEFKSCTVDTTQNSYTASREVIYLPLTPVDSPEAFAATAFDVLTRALGRE